MDANGKTDILRIWYDFKWGLAAQQREVWQQPSAIERKWRREEE